MNQDGLENFFGNVRACCQNKNSLLAGHFRGAFATVFMTNSTSHSIKSNCEPDSATPLLTDIHILLNSKNIENRNSETASNSSNNTDPINVDSESLNRVNDNVVGFEMGSYDPIIFDPEFTEKNLDAIEQEAVFDISKHVFVKLLDLTDECDLCRENLESSLNPSDDSVRIPSMSFTDNFKKIFCNIDQCLESICSEKCVKAKVLESLDGVELKKMGCISHYVHVERKFKEFATLFCIISFCKRINDILGNKIQIYSNNFNLMEQLAFDFVRKGKKVGKHSDVFE